MRLSKSLSICLRTFRSAVITCCVLSSPAAPIAFSSPVVTPKPFAIASANPGICCITELSSCPFNVPIDKACPNWINPASACAAVAPDIATAFDTVSVIDATSP